MTETTLLRQILLSCSRGSVRLWRNNSGFDAERKVHYGLCNGSSDLIGLRTITVTPDMVGQKLAVFAALEVKTPRGKLTEEQRHFLEFISGRGGIAGAVRSVEEARRLLA